MKKDNIYGLGFIILVLDLFVKMLIKNNLHVLESITVIPNFFSIYYIKNKGAAWGMLDGANVLLIIVSLLVLYFLLRYLNTRYKFKRVEVIAYGLLLGGILGNLIERILYHAVTDYLAFNIFSYDFPVFNIADMGIVIGVFLLVIVLFKDEKDKGEKDGSRRKRHRKKN